MTYPGTLALSRAHVTYLADLLRVHRTRIGSRWRRLDPGRQALLVLAHLRNGETYTRLAAGFHVGIATACRYIHEAVDLLAAHASSLTAAMWQLAHNGHQLGVLGGTLVRVDRLSAERRIAATTTASTAALRATAWHPIALYGMNASGLYK